MKLKSVLVNVVPWVIGAVLGIFAVGGLWGGLLAGLNVGLGLAGLVTDAVDPLPEDDYEEDRR